jgi:hypothetical protein
VKTREQQEEEEEESKINHEEGAWGQNLEALWAGKHPLRVLLFGPHCPY